MKLTKEELNQLAEMVKSTNPERDLEIARSLKTNLSLFLWGLQPANRTLENMLLACNQMREDNIVKRIGLDRLEELRKEELIQINIYNDRNFISRQEI